MEIHTIQTQRLRTSYSTNAVETRIPLPETTQKERLPLSDTDDAFQVTISEQARAEAEQMAIEEQLRIEEELRAEEERALYEQRATEEEPAENEEEIINAETTVNNEEASPEASEPEAETIPQIYTNNGEMAI